MPDDSFPAKTAPSDSAQASSSARNPVASSAGQSHVVPCSSAFRDRVLALAERQRVSPADLARSVLLLIQRGRIAKHLDPGEPASQDREEVRLQSGASAGRVLRRKPRLQMRLPKPAVGQPYDHTLLRKALALALSMAYGQSELAVLTEADRKAEQVVEQARDKLAEENEELRRLAADLAMPVLARGITGRADELFVLGFPPSAVPDQSTIKQRWRRLARIYHPDSPFGDHERMTQLNAAAERLV